MALQGTAKIKLSVEHRDALDKLAQFKHSLAGIGKVVAGLGAVFGTAGLGAFASKAVFTAARTRELDVILEQLGKTAGYGIDYLHEEEAAVKELGITTQGARNVLIQFLRSQLDLTKATELATVAQDAAVISKENTADAVEGLINGIITLQPRMLRNHGVVISLQKEYKKWTAANNRTVESLEPFEQQMIALNAVIAYGSRIQGAYTAAMGEAGKRWRSLPRYVEEMFNALGEGLFPAFEAMVDWLTEITKGIQKWGEANQAMIKARVQDYVNILSGAFEKVSGFVREYGREIYSVAKIIVATAIVHKLVKIGQGIYYIATALRALGVAGIFAAGPVGIITAVLSTLAGVLILGADKADEQRRAVSALGQEYLTLADNADEAIESQDALKKAFDKLKKVLPRGLLDIPAGMDSEVDPDVWRDMVTEALVTDKEMLQMAIELKDTRAERQRVLQEMKDKEESDTGFSMAGSYLEGLDQDIAVREKALRSFIMASGSSLAAAKKWSREAKDERPDPVVDVPDERAAYAAAWEGLTAFRIKTLGTAFEKQRAAIRKEQEKIAQTLSEIPGLSPDDLKKALAELRAITDLRLKGVDEKQAAATVKAERKAAEGRKTILLKELDFKRSLFGWSLADYIANLEAQQAAYEAWSEDWKVLEEERQTLMKEQAIQAIDEIKAKYAYWRDFAVDSLMTVSREWKNMGNAIKQVGLDIVNILVRKALTQLIDRLWAATFAAKALSAALPFGWGSGGAPSGGGFLEGGTGVTPPVYSAKGNIITGPTLTMAGEREPELIAPVRSIMNAIRDAGRSGPSFVINLTVPSLDAASFDDYMTDTGGEVLRRLVTRNWLNLGEA